jgi:hypothetical protein
MLYIAVMFLLTLSTLSVLSKDDLNAFRMTDDGTRADHMHT